MDTLMIGYDLNKQEKNYGALIDAIKQIANGYWHHLDSTWFIKSDLSPKDARGKLQQHIDPDDELLVLRVTGALWAGIGFQQSAYDWLNSNL